jgi:hypothetical protein
MLLLFGIPLYFLENRWFGLSYPECEFKSLLLKITTFFYLKDVWTHNNGESIVEEIIKKYKY